MQKKIFIGLVNIASSIINLKKGFEMCGIDTMTVVYNSHAKITDNVGIDYDLGNMPLFWYDKVRPYKLRFVLQYLFNKKNKLTSLESIYAKAIKDCDIFIFIWSSFNADFEDYAYLKSIGKKVITYFMGDDVRWYNAMKQDFYAYGFPPIEYSKEAIFDKNYLHRKLLFLRTAEKYSDLILSNPSACQLALRPYNIAKMIVDTSKFIHNPLQREFKPTIIHAPSHYNIKGSSYVIDVIERLKSENYEFEFKLLQNIPYEKIIIEYSEADILIGQLLIPMAGTQDREVLACGKVVLTSIAYNYAQAPADCPFVDVNPNNLYDELKSILDDYPKRCYLASKGREYIEKYHAPQVIAKEILEAINIPKQEMDYDFYPTFFREKYIPEPENIEVYYKWINFLKDCDWYKEYVPSGERNGLIF